ncbi:DUF2397 family protein [Nocardiopsis alborubida]|uniref:DUF2397 family protein n=1 Tax=Nocardiopsis alborubida TaxID=146802 RepID=A0A7X6RQI2_9ACTN|nr:DUF2397 family protein [Nocardiopsis alborubida]NKY98257.1 DUF2397 family protein [Nocardiopsis alborubida]
MGLNQWTDNHADDGRGADGRPTPRHGRASLLRLAAWFEEADPDRADALAAAAYALHPALHLEGRVDEGVAATTSWWQAEADRSTVTEHPGARPPEPVSDHRAQQARLRDAAESSAHWRRAGAAQIRSLLAEPTGRRTRLDLSGAGMEVLMELLTAALGSGDASRRPTSAGDLEFALRLHVVAAPGADVTIQGEGGELTLEGLRLLVTPYEQHSAGDLAPLPEEPEEGDAELPEEPEPVDPGRPADGSPAEDVPAAGADADPLAAGDDEDLTEMPDKPSEDPPAPIDSTTPASTDVPAASSTPFDPRTPFTPAASEVLEAPSSLAVPQHPVNSDVPSAPESIETSDDPLGPTVSRYSAASDRSVNTDASAAGSADAEASTAPSVPTDPKKPEAPAPLFDPRLSTASDRSANTGTPTAPSAPFDPRAPFTPAASENPESPMSPAASGTAETPAASAEPSFPQSPAASRRPVDPGVPSVPEILGTPAAPSYADILGIAAPAAPTPRPEDTEPTGNLPGPDPETPGPDGLSANPPETRSWE